MHGVWNPNIEKITFEMKFLAMHITKSLGPGISVNMLDFNIEISKACGLKALKDRDLL